MKILIAYVERLHSNKIATIALFLWCLAIVLPCILPGRHFGTTYYGFHIILLGWLLIPLGLLPWLSNLFFLYASAKLILGKNKVTIHAYIALALSFDIIRFTYLPTTQLRAIELSSDFKYGPGTFVWLLAICILLVASGVRNNELGIYANKNYEGSPVVRQHVVGAYATIILIVGTVIFSIICLIK